MLESEQVERLLPPSERLLKEITHDEALWIGPDVNVHEVTQKSPTDSELTGKLTIDKSYFGLQSNVSPFELARLTDSLLMGGGFSARSKLVQAGLIPFFGLATIENGGVV